MIDVLRKVVSVFVFLPLVLSGQESAMRYFNYTAEQGLANNAVHSTLLDKDGFLWIGTEGGLSRFDGRTFTNYTCDPLDSNSLSGNLIVELFQDRTGLIWIAIEDGGISVFNPETERFKRYVFNPDNPLEPGCNKPTAFIEDLKGNIWVAFWNKGMAQFDRKTQRFKTISFDKRKTGYNFNEILDVAADANGLFWICTRAGLLSFNPHNRSFKTHQSGDISDDLLQGIAIGADGTIYCGSWGMGIRIYKPKTNTWRTVTIDSNKKIDGVNHSGQLCFIDENRLLFSNRYKGFGLYDVQTDKIQKLDFEAENPLSIRSQGAGLCVEAVGNNFALGSKGGLHILLGNNPLVELFNGSDSAGDHLLGASVVSSFFPNKTERKIYVGTYYKKGVYVFDENTKEADLKHPASFENEVTSVQTVLKSPFKSNECWWGTHRGLMKIVTSEGGERRLEPIQYATKSEQLIPEQGVYRLSQVGDTVWITCAQHLYAYSPKKDALRDFYPTLSSLLGDSEIRLLSLEPGKKGWFYGITHSRRLFRFNPKQQKANWISLSQASRALPQIIHQVVVSNDGMLWLLEGQTGLAQLNPETNAVRFYTQKDGLNVSRFVSLCTDSKNRIWILSDQGVSVLNPQTGFIRNMGVAQGLSLKDANVIEYHEDGFIYMGGMSKFIRFRPEALLASGVNRNCIVTAISVMGAPIKSDSAYRSIRKIVCNYNENLLAFNFTIPDAFKQSDFYFFTRLDGLDKNWVPAAGSEVSYSGLPPGKYQLNIRAKDGMGNWCSNAHSIEIIITPPFWKTFWFGLLVFTLIFITIFFIVRKRIASIKKRAAENNRIRQQMAELENQALRSQMNPHFIFNCLNSINGFIVGNNPDEASRFVTKFSRLIRLILDNSRVPYVSLEQELSALKIYIDLEKMRFESGFESKIEVNPNLHTSAIFIPPMIFQPFVENAIWHGLLHKETSGKLHVEVNKSDRYLIVTIQDNGIGRAAAGAMKSKTSLKSKSYGLAITRQRIVNFNAGQNSESDDSVSVEDLTDDSGYPCGTLVILKIAIRNEP
jgi:ligand-binding sensor domain-containing protein